MKAGSVSGTPPESHGAITADIIRWRGGADRLESLFRPISIPVALFEGSYGANRDRIVISFRGVAPQSQFHPSQLTDPAWVLC
jgi:hypothetical protein